jgi:hypothetical protein
MPAQPYPYLVITDGTDTVTIQNGLGTPTNYQLVRGEWAPAVPGWRDSPLSGREEYNEVEEEFALNITDTTADGVWSRLDTLVRLLDKADRWRRGENVSAVLIKYAPQGSLISSTADPLQWVIKGRALGDKTSGVKLPVTTNDAGMIFSINDVGVRVLCQGMKKVDTEDSDASTSTTNGDLATINLAGAIGVPSPTRLTITNFCWGKSSGSRFRNSIVMLAELSTDIVIVNAESLANAGIYTSVADSGRNARNTNVLRCTFALHGETTSNGSGALSLTSATDLVAVYANVRNSTTVDYAFRIRVDSEMIPQYTPWNLVAAESSQYPRWFFCGFVSKKGSITNIYMGADALNGSSSFDTDTIVLCDARAVKVFGIDGPGDGSLNFVADAYTFDLNHNLLTSPAPTVLAGVIPVPPQGDIILNTKSANLYGLLLGTGDRGNIAGDKWRQSNGASVYSNVWTAFRRQAYLTPR